MTVKYRTRLTVLLVFDMRGTAENAVPLFLSANRLDRRISSPRLSASILRPLFGQATIAGLYIQNPDSNPCTGFQKRNQPNVKFGKIEHSSAGFRPIPAFSPPNSEQKSSFVESMAKKKRAGEPALFLISFCRAVSAARSRVKAPH